MRRGEITVNRYEAYDLCCQYQGKRVRITDNKGCTHVGRITKVDNRHVWLMPDDAGGYGLGFWGFGTGLGFGFGIALGTITGIALASIFFI